MFKKLSLSDEKSRYLFYWLWVLASRIGPILVIGFKFKVFDGDVKTVYRIAIGFAFVVFWGLIKFWGDFIEYARALPEGLAREVVLGVGHLGPYLIMWGAAIAAKLAVDDFLYITGTMLVFQMVGVIFGAEHKRLRNKILLARGHVRVIK